MIGGLRKMHNEEVHNLYPSPKIKSRRISWAGSTGGKRFAYGVLVGRPGEKRPLGTGYEDNIKLDLEKEDGILWAELIWLTIWISGGTLMNTVLNLRIP
jgi:hypothetical protein